MAKNADLFARLKKQKSDKRDAERATAAATYESHRGDALVALDAWLQAGQPTLGQSAAAAEFDAILKLWTTHGIDRLVDMALDDYKLRHPTARGHRSYLFRADPAKTRTGGYHCRYCAERLTPAGVLATVGEWLSEAFAPVEVQRHLTACALRSLAGQVRAVEPGCSAGGGELGIMLD